MSLPYTTNAKMLNAITTAGLNTSEAFDVSKRQLVTVQFVAADISSGNGVFTIDGSDSNVDSAKWTRISFLDATQTDVATYAVSTTLNSNTTAGAIVKPGWRYIRVNCTITTDGTYSAILECAG